MNQPRLQLWIDIAKLAGLTLGSIAAAGAIGYGLLWLVGQ